MVFTLHDYVLPFLWGLVLLASWIGWGGLIRRLFAPPRDRIDWALQAAWGLAATLILAGFLQPLRLCTTPMLGAIAIAGLALSVGQFLLKLRPPFARKRLRVLFRPRRAAFLIPIILLLSFFYATSIQTHTADPWDDWSAYLPMAKRLAQTGILLDPFSVRRVLTFGGQQVLDAQLLFAGTFFNMDILENGLAKILFAGLLWGYFSRFRRRRLAAVLLLLLLLIPIPHVNINSELTGAVLFLALLRTLQLRPPPNRLLRRGILIGLVAAAFATMRMNYVPTACLALGLFYGAQMLWPCNSGCGRFRRPAMEFSISLAAFVLLLIPWSLVLHESSGTYLYPLFRGTQRPEYDYLSAALTPLQTLIWIARFLGIPLRPLPGILPEVQHPWLGVTALLLPAILAFSKNFRRTVLPFYLAAIAAALLTLITYTLTDYGMLYRFIFPALFAVAAPLLGAAILRSAGRRGHWLFPSVLLAFILAANALRPPSNPFSVARMIDDYWNAWAIPSKDNPYFTAADQAPAYQHAQQAIPAGAPIFVAATYPALFDFSRNPIFPIDMVGGASPAPGMPLLAGPDALRHYLKNRGIDYLIFTDPEFDPAHISRKVWSAAAEHPETQTPAFDRVYKFNLAAIDDFESLAGSGEMLYQDHALRVVRLK